MFSGELWTRLVVVMVVPLVAVLSKPYPITVVVLQETGNTTFAFSYQEAWYAVKFAETQITFAYSEIINFTFIYRNTSCNGEGTAAVAAELHCEQRIAVFIGPACPGALDALLPLAKSWNIAVITPVGSGISDPSLSQMVTKLSPYSVWSYAHAMVAILTKYKWYNFVIIYDESSKESVTFEDGLVSVIGESLQFMFRSYPFKSSTYTPEMLSSLLVDASVHARVYILSCDSRESRTLLLEAYRLGYATSGDYVFFIIDELSKVPSTIYWQMGQPDDAVVLKAMGHVIWPYVDIQWPLNGLFTQVVNGVPADSTFVYNSSGTELSPYLAAYYEAVWIYLGVLLEFVYAGKDPLNGTDLTLSVWNRTYEGIYDPIRISVKGFRENNVTFGYFLMKNGQLKSGDFYDYETGMLEDEPYKGFDWPYSRGLPPPNKPKCGFRNDLCDGSAHVSSTVIGTVAGLLGLAGVTGLIGAVFLYRGWKSKQTADLWWWKIPSSELMTTARNEFSSMYMANSKRSLRHMSTIDVNSLTGRMMEGSMAVWKGQTVGLRRLPLKQLTITKAVLVEFKQVREANHCNVVRVFGACFEDSLKALVTECCTKGSLQDLLGNMNITLDVQFKSSLCRDIIDGLCYIHQSPIHQHGRLNSNVCLIDNRFSVKLTDFGLPTLYSNVLVDVTSDEFQNECKWKAPEILRSGATSTGTREGDIYSYVMILIEVITQDSPFATETAYMTTDDILKKVQGGGDPPFRPAIDHAVTRPDLKDLIHSCWAENPRSRPSCQSVKGSIRKISACLGDSGNLMENLMRRMELYANNLEKMVEEKTAELSEEKKKSEQLLYQILPRSVADRLKSGLRVDPEVYEGVSIYFSDIVGFTEISAVSSPMEVVDLLNDIYSCFDAIIEEFDVYKVETIGDAYMVVSGLPQRNGNLHALNIARMSIKVLETIREFRIRHRPSETVQIRIGLHSGPVCAGVVGSKMPRYCLFGDTVNTASRMESSGKAMMIHISPSTKAMLDEFGSFQMIPRGSITVKGKGQMFTYWLQTSQEESGDLLSD